MLVARTTTRSEPVGWVCQAWYFSAADKAVYTKTSASPAVAIALPTSSPVGSWTLLGSGITESTPGVKVFDTTAEGNFVSILFDVVAGNRKPVRVETKAYTRVAERVGTPCFS
jgi:hypothetical protein